MSRQTVGHANTTLLPSILVWKDAFGLPIDTSSTHPSKYSVSVGIDTPPLKNIKIKINQQNKT